MQTQVLMQEMEEQTLKKMIEASNRSRVTGCSQTAGCLLKLLRKKKQMLKLNCRRRAHVDEAEGGTKGAVVAEWWRCGS